jgi:hypothetical protein
LLCNAFTSEFSVRCYLNMFFVRAYRVRDGVNCNASLLFERSFCF